MSKGFVCLFLLIVSLGSAQAQVRVPLKIDETQKGFSGATLFCDKDYNCGLFVTEHEKKGTYGFDSSPIGVKRSGNDFLFTIDTNLNKSLADEKPF